MRRRTAGLFLAAALLGASCATDAGTTSGPLPTVEPTGATSTAPTPGATTAVRPPLALDGAPLKSCTIGMGTVIARCGFLSVPEDRSKPAGRWIDLHVAVIPASSMTPEPDPVFMLAGGPGGAASETLAWTGSVYDGIHQTRDIVLVDQRGTGGSNEYLIGTAPDVAGLPETEADAVIQAWADAQLESFGGDPRLYTTYPAMDDLDDVRAALGYDRINLYGGSYGATAAQYYIRQHEDRIRTVILDGATLISVPILELIAPNSQRALDLLFARCAADAACHAAFPDPAAELADALAQLADGPITTSVSDPATRKPMVLDVESFTGAIHAGLLNSETAAAVPLLISAASAGRWDDVAGGIAAVAAGQASDAGTPLMSAEIFCSEAWAVYDPDEVLRRGGDSYLVANQVASARARAAGCRYAPAGIVPPDDGKPARSDVPVLFVVGDADPQDPPANIADAPLNFPNSLTVVASGHGHTVAHIGCMPRIVDAFVEAGTVVGLDTSCIERGMPLPPFRLP